MLNNAPGRTTLTPAEQLLVGYLAKDSLVSFRNLQGIYQSKKIGSKSYFSRIVSSLLHKKYLLQIKKGLYYAALNQPYDEFLLGQYLFGGYIGFSTALWLHGMKTETPSTCYIVVYKGKKAKRIGSMQYQAISLGEKAVGSFYLGKHHISTKAKTLFDCFYMPKYAGGFSQIIYSLSSSSINNEEWREFLEYIHKFGSSTTVQRAGFVLSLLRKKNPKFIPAGIINSLREELKKRKRTINILNPSFARKGKFIKEWGIYDNMGEERIMGE